MFSRMKKKIKTMQGLTRYDPNDLKNPKTIEKT
jgi:hypothetical protein